MDGTKLVTSDLLYIEESLNAFVSTLYRIFHCATVKNTPTLERFKYVYFTDELIHEQFKELRMNHELMNVYPQLPDISDLLINFRKSLSQFITKSHFLLEKELLPQLAESGFVYQKISESMLCEHASLMVCMEKICLDLIDFPYLNDNAFKKIKDNSLNYLIVWKGHPNFSILKIPYKMEKVLVLRAHDHRLSHHALFHIDDLVKFYVKKMYNQRIAEEIIPFRLTIDGQYERKIFFNKISQSIDLNANNTEHLQAFNCLETEQAPSKDILVELLRTTKLTLGDCYIEPNLHQAGDFFKALTSKHPQCSNKLMYPPLIFQKTNELVRHADFFAKLQTTDVLFHHPYQPYDEVLDFFQAAATDRYVTHISITIYRIEPASKLLKSLKLAASLGKKVKVLIELRVTGYEKNHWQIAQDLKEHGVEVFFGPKEWVTHAKMALIKRETESGLEYYSHLSTGNYHQQLTKTYCDLSLITSHFGIGKDIEKVFASIFEEQKFETLEHVIVSPLYMRAELIRLIQECGAEAKKNKQSSIFIKVKDFTDIELVHALYAAAKVGVQVLIFVRNKSLLKPGNPRLTCKIRVLSYVGRFLEHHRVYCFKTEASQKILIGSCNMTKKNIDQRIELIFPIYQAAIQTKIKEDIIENIQQNTNHCWEMNPNGDFQLIRNKTQDFQSVLIRKYEKKSV